MGYSYAQAKQRVDSLSALREAIAKQRPTEYGAGGMNILASLIAGHRQKKARGEAQQAQQGFTQGVMQDVKGQAPEFKTPVVGPTQSGQQEMAMSKEAVQPMGLAESMIGRGNEFGMPDQTNAGFQALLANQAAQQAADAKNISGFEGTGMMNQSFNQILQTVPEEVRPFLMAELAKEYAGKERMVQTASGPQTVPGVNYDNAIAAATAKAQGDEYIQPAQEGERVRTKAPLAAMTAHLSNSANSRRVDSILELIENPDMVDTLGPQNIIPGADLFYQFTQPEATRVRALVSALQNMEIKDMSGAAVTASEEVRLKPYIPNLTDRGKVLKEKLRMFSKEYKVSMKERSDVLEEQGHLPITAGESGGSGQKGWKSGLSSEQQDIVKQLEAANVSEEDIKMDLGL